MKQKKLARLLSFVLAAVMIIATVPASSAVVYVVTKDTSVLTVDADGSGYIRGIWGTTTAGKLTAQFTGNVVVRRNGISLSASDAVASDDVVCGTTESFPVIIYGDVNRDALVNLTDASTLMKFIAGWSTDMCAAAADVMQNGKSDLGDVSHLLKWIAGWDVTLGDAVFPKTELSLSGFTVVIPRNADHFEMEAADAIADMIDNVYDKRVGSDRIITDDESANLEILIGNTARSRTAESKAKISGYDWVYTVPTNKTVIITGTDSIGTYEAAQAFIWDIFGYVNEHNTVNNYTAWNGSGYVDVTTGTTVTTGTEKIYSYTPSDEKLVFGNTPAEDLDIVCRHPDSAGAKLLCRSLLRETGVMPDVIRPGDEGSSPVIRLGTGAKDGSTAPNVSGHVFAIYGNNGDIVIDVPEQGFAVHAARAFVKWYIVDRVPFDEDQVRYGGVGSHGLIEKSVTETVLDDGVTYYEMKMEDVRNQPVLAYLVKVENGASRVMMGTPGNGTAISGVKATVKDAMNAAEADGIEVVAGINADFFHIESDYRPQGLCVKDGVILKGNDENRAWIALMKDGNMDCGVAGEARRKISDMEEGFGASHVLMKNGSEYQTDVNASFAEIRHPRSAMGYDSDGNVYLLVVDGRRPKLSNGASLLDLMLILRNAGAQFGVNLDGGGSSALVIDNGGFKTANSPSDGTLRKVYNSVLITK